MQLGVCERVHVLCVCVCLSVYKCGILTLCHCACVYACMSVCWYVGVWEVRAIVVYRAWCWNVACVLVNG